jgi:phytoene desaturase
MKKIAIIGSGFSSLSAACYLAREGFQVDVFEKNDALGGRARQFKKNGFTFDMGPSWYWMPDIFDRFFNDFDKKVSDYYQLEKLDPAYQVFFEDDTVTIGDSLEKISQEFERIEKGSSKPLKKFMAKAEENYEIAIKKMVYKPGLSPLELISKDSILGLGKFITTIGQQIRKAFKNPKLVSILEFPVLFLGAKASNTPAFYSFMNQADFGLGTWHPKGGMHQIVLAMTKLGTELGVRYHTQSTLEKIIISDSRATGIQINGQEKSFDVVLSGADYHHTETLLPRDKRQYNEAYWKSRVFAPSSLLFYVGFDTKLKNLQHHNLFFDTDFELHSAEIYDTPSWPKKPLFYANFPSITDQSMAPSGKETGFFLIPIALGLEDNSETRDHYFNLILERLKNKTKIDVSKHIEFKESFCVSDFVSEYNSYGGNAYGLANTLKQTAFLRPNLKSSKVKNLYFTGQLTVPGPGVPPALISGKLVADLIIKKQGV